MKESKMSFLCVKFLLFTNKTDAEYQNSTMYEMKWTNLRSKRRHEQKARIFRSQQAKLKDGRQSFQ